MEILVSIATKIVEYTVAPIGRQMGYVFSYKDNFQKLSNQLVELEGAKDIIEHWVNDERRNGKQIEAVVQNWMDKANEITKEAKQLCEDPCHEKVACSKCSFPNLWQQHQLSRKAKKVANNVAHVLGAGKFDRDKIGSLPAIGGVGSTSATSRFVDFESRMSKMNEIMQALADPKVSILGVYGLGGVGKSTLVEQVAGKAKSENLVNEAVMASVTQCPDLKRIQGEIADQLGLHFTEESVVGRAYRLRERINMEKNILIILDDIWATVKLEEIGIPYRGKIYMENQEMESQDDHMGCKVLLISRNQDVLHQMETQKDFRLEVLSEQETWCLFGFMAGDVAKDANYQDTAIEVAKKCAGLPVLIVTVARALKQKGIIEWKDALSQLARVDNKELREITYSALELSYNQLESDEVKALFLLCGVEGPSVVVEDLLKYAMGLGLFKPINSLKDARNRLHKFIGALKASCLLLEDDTNVKIVRMHEIIHEVAISIASRDEYIFIRKEDFELKEWPIEDLPKRCPQIILRQCSIPKLPERLDCAELEFLHLNTANNHFLEIPDSIFEGMGKLQVLDLTCMSLSSLPTSLSSLINLQTLCLRECSLGNVAGIGALKSLKILNLAKSSMKELPSEIVKLTNLRMLDMSNSRIEVIPPNIISSLTTLEELYMGDTSIKWEVGNSANQSKNVSLAELKQLPNLSALDIQIQEVWILPRDLMFDKLERYKILIGDVWGWSDKYEATKTLKLKLPTSIHLEHGIKTLIKRVESLCMDEINGISNVLYELNAEGFPLLKNLHIQNNKQIQHIIDSTERNQTYDSFPSLETLGLQNLIKLEKLCHGPLAVNSLSKLKVIEVQSCDQLKYLFSCSLVKMLSQLTKIEVSKCSSMQNIVFVENDCGNVDNGITETIEFCRLQSLTLKNLPMLDGFFSKEFTKQKDKQLATCVSDPFFGTKVAFPNLKTLKFNTINLNKIWDIDQLSTTSGIQNLTRLIVKDCSNLKHLFSYSMIGSLSKLKQLEISKCHMMEEIIYPEEGRNNGVASKEVQFLSLEKIKIKDMEKLRTVWHCQFDGLKSMVINNCEKLVCTFPSYMQRKFHSLDTLTVRNCGSIKEIFELDANEIGCEEEVTKLAKLTLFRLPKLRQIWSVDPDRILNFPNLQAVDVGFCDNLEYLFPLSIATRLQKIEELNVRNCGNMKEIVANKGQMEGPARFVLNQLTALQLRRLYQLGGFYVGNYTLSCPSLKKIRVSYCEKLVLFKTESMNCQERHHNGELRVPLPQSLFTVEEMIPNLEEVTLNHREATMTMQCELPRQILSKLKSLSLSELEDEYGTVVDCFLQNAPSLETLAVQNSLLKVIFRAKGILGEDGQFKTSNRLKNLSLLFLPELQHICEEGCQIDPMLEDLETLRVLDCSSLINLVPSSLAFVHLTTLDVWYCNGLINLLTSTAARSLVKLERLRIRDCTLLEDIVTEKGDEAKDEIAFSSLIALELISLPRLGNFCSTKCYIKFPLLSRVVVQQCPRMEIFSVGDTSTPNLRKVQVNDTEWCWEDNINGTIQKMFADKVAFQSFKSLNLTEFPELKDLWYGPSVHNMFQSLKSLVVHKCDFLSDVLFTSNLLQLLQNLEDLEVKDCDSIEAVFDVKGMDDKEVLVKQTTQMKKLTLSGLLKLKHIWNKDPQEIISFKNLHVVRVSNCKMLKNLFLVSLCKDLGQLEELDIESCGVEEIVANEEELEECRFDFPQLTRVRLWRLPKLRSFYPRKHALECPSLKDLNVYHCEALQIFGFSHSDFQHQHQVNEVDIPIQQALFSAEKVCSNLEKLALNGQDVMAIKNCHLQANLFDKVEVLCLQCFRGTPAIFPNEFLQRFTNLITLAVECSSFVTLFPHKEGAGHHITGTPTQVKELRLSKLEELEYIWNEDHQSDALVQLESSEIKLVTSPNSFENLITLDVKNCKALIYLITSSMAKSLRQLRKIILKKCEKIEEVVKIDEQKAEEVIIFENLEYLELNSLSSFRNFCSGKYTLIFPYLLRMKIKGCPKMKIFSSGVTITPLLRAVELQNGRKCWNGDLNTTIEQLYTEKVAFHSFKCLNLIEFPELKDLWYGPSVHNMFQSLKSLVVHNCDFLSDVLFTSNLLQVLQNLEDLEVQDCNSIEAVFNVKGMDDKEVQVKQTTQMKKLTLSGLPKLKHIWNKDPQEIISFKNLCVVRVSNCKILKNLFSVSLCQDLGQLKELDIESCGLEEIVANEEELEECRFDFPHLTRMRLWRLSKLRGFYPRKHALECPSLQDLNVYHCEALQIFGFSHSDFQNQHQVNEVDIPIQQALFSAEKVCINLEKLAFNSQDVIATQNCHLQANLFDKVEVLRLQCFSGTPAIFPNEFLQRFTNLIKLVVRFSSFQTLFPHKEGAGHHITGTPTQVKELRLSKLEELEYIWNEDHQSDALVQLESSEIKLVTSPNSFENLITLDVKNCKALIYLITSSMAKNLRQLRKIILKKCEKIEEVVKIGEQKAEEVIIFENLEYLELNSLSSFRNFCSGKYTLIFPYLLRMKIKGCPKMKIFSSGVIITPLLRAVELQNGRKCWNGDLNTTIEQLYTEKVAFHSFKCLNLIEFPELKDLWYGPSVHNMFQSLKSLVVHNCDFLSDVLFTSNLLQVLQNLEDLEVQDCNSIEAVFNVKGMDDKEVQVKQTTQMKKLTLSGLPKLKHIWNKDPQEFISFKNLRAMQVADCERLEYLFPLSLCQDLELLEELDIESCGLEEIVANEEELEECRFDFPHLTRMRLWRLSKLRGFYPRKHALECPSLQDLNVYHCEALQIFGFSHSDFQHQHQVNEVDIPIQQALFSAEKVCFNLEKLALNSQDVIATQNCHLQANLFDKVEVLRLQCFNGTPAIFPNEFLQRFTNLIKLVVRFSSFKTLFPHKEGAGHHITGTPTQVKELRLSKLEELEYIWNEDHQSDALVQLESSEIKLVTSPNSFENLITLDVKNCKALIYLITSSMAKNLRQLRKIILKKCEKIEEVVKIDEQKAEEVIKFENLEYLELNSLSSFRNFCSGKYTLIFPYLLRLKIKGCSKMKIFSSGVIITPLLRAVELQNGRKCWNGDLNTTIEQLYMEKVAFPNSETLKLTSINLNKIGNDDQLFATCGIQNLTSMIVKDCGNLKHLFSYSMIGSLSKLKQLQISECHMMEHIIDPEEGRENGVSLGKVRFQNLEKIIINDMENLRTVWHCQFDGVKTMEIKKCGKLVCIFPSYMQRKFLCLGTLMVRDCGSVEEIFQLNASETHGKDGKTELEKLTLFRLPKLKQIWSTMGPDRILSFPNLKAVHVKYCDILEYLFPLSIAVGLQKIEELIVRHCRNMKELVEKKGETEKTVTFVLDRLTSLDLMHLRQFKGFYAGNYTLACPSLKQINVIHCKKLKLFKTQSRRCQESDHDVKPLASLQQPLFTIEEDYEEMLKSF